MGEKSIMMMRILMLVCMVVVCRAESSTLASEFLNLHNSVRREVGVGPLEWDTTLEAFAKDYAQQRSGDCAIIHSGGPYGENIYWGSGLDYNDAEAAMTYWVNEKDFYHYDTNTCDPGQECLHYTQIVWRDSTRLGCASAACPDDKIFFTCNYDPRGNIEGERPY